MATTVVADIGGTSSRWGVIAEGRAAVILDGLPGFNPAVGEPNVFVAALKERFRAEGVEVDDLFAYGAGCGSLDRSTRMAEALLSVFPGARVDVASDLMGAAHGLLGGSPGLVLILGTGMNAGYFDGTDLHQPMPSLGYILGDEGSGADIGKHFLHDALHGRVPDVVVRNVFPDGLDVVSVIERLYRGAGPQAWLAGYAASLAPLRSEEYVRMLIDGRFRALAELIRHHFADMAPLGIRATGSVAYGYEEFLDRALTAVGFRLNGVEPSPLQGLLRYRSVLAR